MSQCAAGCVPNTTPNSHGACVVCGRAIEPAPAGRDELHEGEFLELAERRAQRVGFGYSDQVKARLARAEREKGVASYAELGVPRLFHEITEESLDVSGWSVLLDQVLVSEGLDVDALAELRGLLIEISACGAVIEGLVTRAVERYHDAQPREQVARAA